MSNERAAMKRQAGPPPSIFGRGPMGGFGMPVQKAKDVLDVRVIEDVTPLPHNGCRPRKKRRV